MGPEQALLTSTSHPKCHFLPPLRRQGHPNLLLPRSLHPAQIKALVSQLRVQQRWRNVVLPLRRWG